MNLIKNIKITKVKDGQTSAGTAINSDEVDMEGYEGVIFFMRMATANAGNFINVAQSSTSGGTFTDLANTKVVPGDDNDVGAVGIEKPSKQFLRCEVDRSGTNTATGEIYALQYGARVKPTTHSTEIDSELHVSPAEGTA